MMQIAGAVISSKARYGNRKRREIGKNQNGTKKTAPKKESPPHVPFSTKNIIFTLTTPATVKSAVAATVFHIGKPYFKRQSNVTPSMRTVPIISAVTNFMFMFSPSFMLNSFFEPHLPERLKEASPSHSFFAQSVRIFSVV